MKPAWRRRSPTVYGKRSPANGSPEGRWEGEGGHKIEPKHAADPTPRRRPIPASAACRSKWNGKKFDVKHGDVVIAAITSCTNTSNPSVMIAAGLLAKKAVEKGLKVPPHVKTSLAPGSRVVTDYFDKAGLDEVPRKRRLLHRRLRLHDLHRQQRPAARADLARPSRRTTSSSPACSPAIATSKAASTRDVKANYLASPPLVVAYALAGTTDIDFEKEPIGTGKNGTPVYLRDIWPTHAEVQAVVDQCVLPEMFDEPIRQRLGQEPQVERDQDERRRALRLGRRRAPTSRSRRSSSTSRRSRARSSRSTAPAAWRRSAIR